MATSFAVDLVLKTQGGQKIREVSNQLQGLSKQGKGAQQSLDGTARGLNNTSRAAATATGNIQRMGVAFRSTLGPIVAAYGAVNFLTRSLKIAGDREADVAVLTNGLEKLGQTKSKVDDLVKAADRLGKVTLFNQDDFTQAFGLLTSFRGIAVSSYERVAEAAADVAQVTRQDVSSSMLQLAKALENPVEGMTALSRSGTTFTKQQKEVVKQLVETNRVAEAQEFILSEVEKQYKGSAAAAGKAGFAGKVDELSESFADLSEMIGKTFAPVLDNIIEDITAMVNTFVSGLQAMERAYKGFMQRLRSTTVTGLTSDIAGLDERIANQQAQLGKVNEAAPGGVGQAKRFRETITQLRNLRSELQADLGRLQGFDTFTPEPIKFKASGGDTVSAPDAISKSSGAGKTKAQNDELKKQQQELQRIQDAYDGIFESVERSGLSLEKQFEDQKRLNALLMEGVDSETAKKAVAFEREIKDLQAERAEKIKELKGIEGITLQQTQTGEAEINRIYNEREATAARLNQAKERGNQLLDEAAEKSRAIQAQEQMLQNLYDGIGSTIANGIGGAIDAVANGTEDLGKTLQKLGQQILAQVGKMLIFYALAQAFGALAGPSGGGSLLGGIAKGFGFQFKAGGGPIQPGGSYIVGEKGPELLQMNADGTGYVNSTNSEAMSRYRPGRGPGGSVGAASSGDVSGDASGQTIDVAYTVERINERNYVTEEAFRAGLNQAAKRGAEGGYTKTMGSMRNSRSTRARLGMG